VILEKFILALSWIISIVCFYLFIPKDKRRNAHVAFLLMQVITWPIGLEVVNLEWIKYPVRLFPNASQTSFTFEFLVYPVIAAFFNVYYPENKATLAKLKYYIIICSSMTGFELLLEENTQLITYINWTSYHTWITGFITLYICRLYYRWFFKIP
jgi:hypothetical protein